MRSEAVQVNRERRFGLVLLLPVELEMRIGVQSAHIHFFECKRISG
jgi:hypothetical protein